MTRNKTVLIPAVCNPVCMSKLCLPEHEASVHHSAVICTTVPIPYFASDSLALSGTQSVLAVQLNCVHRSVIVALCSGTQ